MKGWGLFAVPNFVLNVLLAQRLNSQDYGAFSVAFAVFLPIGVCHQGVLAEPMLVFGPGRHKGQFSGYSSILPYVCLGFAGLSSILLLLGDLVFALSGLGAISAVLLAPALTESLSSLFFVQGGRNDADVKRGS